MRATERIDYCSIPTMVLPSKRGELRVQVLNVPSSVAAQIISDVQEAISAYTAVIRFSFLEGKDDGSISNKE